MGEIEIRTGAPADGGEDAMSKDTAQGQALCTEMKAAKNKKSTSKILFVHCIM